MIDNEIGHQILTEVRDLHANMARLEATFHAHKEEVDSDIRELKRGGRQATRSVTDLQQALADEKIAELQLARDQWKARGWEIAKWVLFGILGVLGTLALQRLTGK